MEFGLQTLLSELGYDRSPSYLARGRGLESAPDFGHIYRRAVDGRCNLQGVYRLRPPQEQASSIPIVYVCQAESETAAQEVHRLVWNQGLVPFLIVVSPRTVRLYSGFNYRRGEGGKKDDDQDLAAGLLEVIRDTGELIRVLEDLRAEAIDSGQLWRNRGQALDVSQRVDWNLLENLKRLGQWLIRDGGLGRPVAHALIGKYVYLHYLKDRQILSPRKLEGWDILHRDVFGRSATLDGLRRVTERLEGWLNGQVFPLPLAGPDAPSEAHLRRVAGAFAGDREVGDGARQLHLAFDAYDFSYIPIETLSVIYEQFLHAEVDADARTAKSGAVVEVESDADIETPEESLAENDTEARPPPRRARARKLGAFYTPIPLVNFALDELDSHRPLKRGVRVLDPACGSGAFLVQCYRRLIERSFPAAAASHPQPAQLRELLTEHVFGVDLDEDACRVTEMSLVLTLLDYVDPPDLENVDFKLPSLHNANIFHGDFFDPELPLNRADTSLRFERIVANPPWKNIKPGDLDREDRLVWEWMRQHQKTCPVGDNQVARAFVWKALDHLADSGDTGMVIPAMTLFDNPSKAFRREFFNRVHVRAVANFSNLAEVLFAGRSRVPAALFVYTPKAVDAPAEDDIPVFSPLVANQELTRPSGPGKRTESWSLALNASEVREISIRDARSGSGLPWKLATWGSFLDQRLLDRVAGRFPTLGSLEKASALVISEGPQLRGSTSAEPVEIVSELEGACRLEMSVLKFHRNLFSFPSDAIVPLESGMQHLRIRGGIERPLSICRPPHVIVSEARTFAVYSDDFLVVPARQIGIMSTEGDRELLIALSLYLSSDFMFYHQFMVSSHFGVKRPVATLRALRQLPVPLARLPRRELGEWVVLHERLVRASRQGPAAKDGGQIPLQSGTEKALDRETEESLESLLNELNERVYDSLQIREHERCLVHDLVRVRLALDDGKIGPAATRRPDENDLRAFGRMLKQELDAFVAGSLDRRHQIQILPHSSFGVAEIRLDVPYAQGDGAHVVIVPGDPKVKTELQALSRQLVADQSQWIVFNRNLRVYRENAVYLFKPMQRFHWTESQARLDAAAVIAETLTVPGGEA